MISGAVWDAPGRRRGAAAGALGGGSAWGIEEPSGFGPVSRVARGDVGVELGDGVERLEDRRADRRAPPGRRGVEGAQQVVVARGGGDGELGEAGEEDEADLRLVVLALDEGADGGLGGGEPVGVDVGGAHRARDVEREDHGGARDGHVGAHLRTGAGDAEQAEAGQHEGDRHVPAPAAARTERRADERDVGVAHGRGPAAPQLPEVGGEEQRHRQQQQEQERLVERHVRSPGPGAARRRRRPRAGAGRRGRRRAT